jgi:hypothetical protein
MGRQSGDSERVIADEGAGPTVHAAERNKTTLLLDVQPVFAFMQRECFSERWSVLFPFLPSRFYENVAYYSSLVAVSGQIIQ